MTMVRWIVAICLALDFLGVIAVAYVPERWGTAVFGGGVDFDQPHHRCFYRLAWGAIALGFLLQLVAQLLSQ